MSRSLFALTLFALGFLVATLTLREDDGSAPVWAQVAGPDCAGAGDLNADSMVNISDAVFLLGHLFTAGPAPAPCCPEPSSSAFFPARLDAATIVVVRHAEKGSGDNPGLTDEGETRARELARVLAGSPVTHLIASDLRRTQETLAPLAGATSLAIAEVVTEDDVVARVEDLPAGSLAVIAHHSFTIPGILRGLGFNDLGGVNVSGSNFDNFLVVFRAGGTAAQLVKLRYGAPAN